MVDECMVQLSPGAAMVGSVIATMRQEVNRAAGRTNLKAGPQDPMTTELVGIYGELGFAEWANVWPDLSIHLRSGGADCIFRGWTVDVKATRKRPDPRWYPDIRPDKQAHVYVFVQVEYATVEICGWLLPEEIGKDGVAWKQLHHPSSLLDLEYYE